MSTMRMTIQRRKILATVQGLPGHVSAETIYHRLKPEMPELSPSTVYRNLKALADMGRVSVTDMGQGWVFEAVGGTPHHHLVCLGCGEVEDLSDSAVRPFFDQLERRGFHVATNHLCIYGYCSSCQEKAGAQEAAR